MDIITVQDLCKTFTYSTKEKGLKGSLRNLFNRQLQTKTAVNGVSFTVEKGGRPSACWGPTARAKRLACGTPDVV